MDHRHVPEPAPDETSRAGDDRLRAAVAAELTHDGVVDELAQCATILGCLGDDDAMYVGRRLDALRTRFHDAMRAALDVEPPSDGIDRVSS